MPARPAKRTRGKNEYYLMGSNNVECDRTGFKMKADQCRFEWNGFFVRGKSWEERQPKTFCVVSLIASNPKYRAPVLAMCSCLWAK